ncbi:hypothetical protein [Flavitalea sp.]|nr:hypothetical protein [Flavitalea sp.]
MKRICCYSLSIPEGGRSDLLTQIITSVDSLRSYNKEVGIILFAYGDLPMNLMRSLQMLGVRIWLLPPYSARLSQICPIGWQFLCQYPLLHKFLNFAEISSLDPDQVLLLDCDTYFQGDVARLFDQYSSPDLVACEEVGSRRSRQGYHRSMIDEDNLIQIGSMVGINPAQPFNLGVVLLNNGIWKKLAGLSTLHISYAWRFMVWMAANPSEPDSEYGEGVGVDDLRQHWSYLAPGDQFLALPYPSKNRWILDEVTLWMTLGHLPNTTFQDFNHTDVIQSVEFTEKERIRTWVVCHYFSQNLNLISNWVRNKADFVST